MDNYINRSLEDKWLEYSREYACLLLTGARQVGKSTMLRHLAAGDGVKREFVTLDNLTERNLAKNDPQMFLKIHKPPLFIDEIQYAPELFSYIKIMIDDGIAPGSFFLSGSQKFSLMHLAQESLAGRAGILEMGGLSNEEMQNVRLSSFCIDFGELSGRAGCLKPKSIDDVYAGIFTGSMPALCSGKISDRDFYYDSYVRTYAERDLLPEDSSMNVLQFSDFLRVVAARIGQVLNVHSIASDMGIRDEKVKLWLYYLERSGIVFFLRPYSANLSKRMLKSPKMYFSDTGLVSYLMGYRTALELSVGAMNGAVLENYVVSEIIKSYGNHGRTAGFYYYRDKDKNEVDMIVSYADTLDLIEVKRTATPVERMIKSFDKLKPCARDKHIRGALVCMVDSLSAFDSDNLIVPVWMI